MSIEAIKAARRELAAEFLDFAKVPGQSGKIAGGMAVEAIAKLAQLIARQEANAVINERVPVTVKRPASEPASAPAGAEWKEPPFTCPHIEVAVASGQLSDDVKAELHTIREINSQLRHGTWALKARIADLEARIATAERERDEARERAEAFARNRIIQRDEAEAALADLRAALANAAYYPGDCPILPVKVAAFMDKARALLTSPTADEAATRTGGDPDRPAPEAAPTDIAPPAREGEEPLVPATGMPRRDGWWTHDDEAAMDVGHLYYFAPANRAPPPYKKQIQVRAIIDVADDGTLAGVELIDDMPPPPQDASEVAATLSSPEREAAIRGLAMALAEVEAWMIAAIRDIEVALAAARAHNIGGGDE